MTWINSLTSPMQLWWQVTTDQWNGKAPKGAKRSAKWSKFRDEFLKTHPVCACCGGKVKLEVHHVIPFNVDPTRELDPENLMPLCESGKHGVNCHLFVGHLGNYSRWNPIARIDAKLWSAKLSGWLSGKVQSSHHAPS